MKRPFKSPTRRGTKKAKGLHAPTIGVGEDAIKGRGNGGRIPHQGKGALGENIPISTRDSQAIANIDASQQIMTGGSGDEGTDPGNDIYT